MIIGCLDLGSNTFHLEHFEVEGARVRASLVDTKVVLKLGESVFRTGGIDRVTWQAGTAAVGTLLEASRSQPAERLTVIATSAIRRARNGAAFVRALESRYSIVVEMLSPRDEARLAYLGALRASHGAAACRTAVVDVGGGSAEVTVGDGERILFSDSFPLGVLRVVQDYAAAAPATQDTDELIRKLKLEYGHRLSMLAALRPTRVVLASGTARAVRKLAMTGTPLPGKVGTVTLQALRTSLEQNRGHSIIGLLDRGVDPARADTILVAHAVLIAVLDGLGVEAADVADGGLRHGIALRDAPHVYEVTSRLGASDDAGLHVPAGGAPLPLFST